MLNLNITELLDASKIAGFSDIDQSEITIKEGHTPEPLKEKYGAVYIFRMKDESLFKNSLGDFLKVGKVSSPKSNPRYTYQHYKASANGSTLAKSLVNDPKINVKESDVKNWILENTERYNLIIPNRTRNFIHFAEAFYILKLQPRFEKINA